MAHFSLYQDKNQRPVNTFYKRNKQNVSCNREDRIYVATSQITQNIDSIIAVLFLRPHQVQDNTIWLLRSLFVAPEYRQLGVAKGLVNFALKSFKQSVFLLCEPPLLEFYNEFKFELYKETIDNNVFQQQIKKGLCLLHRPSQS